MFKNNFVVALKHNNNILRELNDEVLLPFGSEYSILFKNLNSQPVQVKISIDGKDVLDNEAIFINANSEFELQGFIKSGNITNKFKFIQKTSEINMNRKDLLDDSIIRVEFTYQKPTIEFNYTYTWQWFTPTYPTYYSPRCGQPRCSCPVYVYQYGSGASAASSFYNTDYSFSSGDVSCSTATNESEISSEASHDEGLTVPGNQIYQKLHENIIDNLENQSTVISFKLRGFHKNGSTKIDKPITTRSKVSCPTCGFKSRANWCSRCGTNLIL